MNYQYNCQVTQNNLASWLRIGDHQNLEQAYKAYLYFVFGLRHTNRKYPRILTSMRLGPIESNAVDLSSGLMEIDFEKKLIA